MYCSLFLLHFAPLSFLFSKYSKHNLSDCLKFLKNSDIINPYNLKKKIIINKYVNHLTLCVRLVDVAVLCGHCLIAADVLLSKSNRIEQSF